MSNINQIKRVESVILQLLDILLSTDRNTYAYTRIQNQMRLASEHRIFLLGRV